MFFVLFFSSSHVLPCAAPRWHDVAESLSDNASAFSSRAKQLHRRMWWRDMKVGRLVSEWETLSSYLVCAVFCPVSAFWVMSLTCVISSTDEDDHCSGSCCSPADYYQWVLDHEYGLNLPMWRSFAFLLCFLLSLISSSNPSISLMTGGWGRAFLHLVFLYLHSSQLQLGSTSKLRCPYLVSAYLLSRVWPRFAP